MHPAARTTLSFLTFFVAVIGLTFATTFVHEMSHAGAWGDMPNIEFHENRAAAEESIAQRETRKIDGQTYRVDAVETTTIALYPKNILIVGATLGLAPSSMLPDAILGSTFYSLDDEHYHDLAHGHDVTKWHHAAMPMIVNGILAIPIIVWVILKTNALSMAALWVNASEWRFNLHHAEEIGIPSGLYLGLSLIIMMAAAMAIGILSGRQAQARRTPLPVPTDTAEPA